MKDFADVSFGFLVLGVQGIDGVAAVAFLVSSGPRQVCGVEKPARYVYLPFVAEVL